MADLEQAFFPSELHDELPNGCSRIYFGAEFCFWRLPPPLELLRAIEWSRQRACGFTLVTPVLGEDERLRLADVFKKVLPALASGDEVLISDWGALELVRDVCDDLQIVLGRTLSGQKRGPRILDMQLSQEQQEYFRRSSWHNSEAVELLTEQGIARVELDNLLQGLAPLPEGLKGSLHVPYAMVTSSRNCPFREPASSGPCPAPCGDVFTLQSNETDVLLYQDGNTQFLLNDHLPEDLDGLGISRVVTHLQPGL